MAFNYILPGVILQQLASQRRVQEAEGRGAPGVGHLYTGSVPLNAWIEREQQQLHSTTGGPAPERRGASSGSHSNGAAAPAATAAVVTPRERGNDAFRAGRLEEAMRFYTLAIDVDDNREIAYANRAALHQRLHNYEAAAADARRAVQLSPDYFKGHFRLGQALFSLGSYESALAAFNHAKVLCNGAQESEELEKYIAKTMSKLQRASTTGNNPSSTMPPGASSSAILGAGVSLELPGGIATPAERSFFTPQSGTPLRGGGGGLPGTPASAFAAQPPALELPTSTSGPVSSAPDALSNLIAARRRTACSASADGVVDCLDRVGVLREQAEVRRLLQSCDPQAVESAMDAFNEAQERVRIAAQGTDRDAFRDAVRSRDTAAVALRQAVGSATEASSRLSAVAQAEATTRAQLSSTLEPALKQHRAEGTAAKKSATAAGEENSGTAPQQLAPDDGAAASSAPSAVYTAAGLARLVQRYVALRRSIHDRLSDAAAATERACQLLLKAVQEETQTHSDAAAIATELADTSSELLEHCRGYVTETPPLIPAERETMLEQLGSVLGRASDDLRHFDESAADGERLLVTEAELERLRLELEKQRIHLNADLEWLAVKDEEETGAKAARLRDKLRNVKLRIANTTDQQQKVQQRVVELMNAERPELAWRAAAERPRIMKWLKGSGWWVSHSFADYEIVGTVASTPNSKVYHAKANKQLASSAAACSSSSSMVAFTKKTESGSGSLSTVALKEIPMESEAARRRFRNEINIISQMKPHPNVIRILGVFFDGPFAYVVMPFYPQGNLKQRIANPHAEPMPEWRQQDFCRQIVSAVAHLHDHGVVHADLKPSNILLTDDGNPLLTDFGLARDVGANLELEDVTWTGAGASRVVGTLEYMAPELLPAGGLAKAAGAGGLKRPGPTTHSDLWSLGLTLFQLARANALARRRAKEHGDQHAQDGAARKDDDDDDDVTPALMLPSSTSIAVSAYEVGGSDRMADLLTSMLQAEPSRRVATAQLCLSHPYFAVSLITDMVQSHELIESNHKLDALRRFLHTAREGLSPVMMSVVRSQMVESVSSVFQQLNNEQLLAPLFVVFRGEQGIDEGGLLTEMLAAYWQQCVSKHRLLEHAGGDGAHGDDSDHVGGDVEFATNVQYTLSTDTAIPTAMFETMGKLLVKSVVEGRPLPLQLNGAVFKFLVGTDPTLHDLEEYDRPMARNLKSLLYMPPEDLADSALDFSDLPDAFLAERFPGQDVTGDTCVTTANVKQYVDARVYYVLVYTRRRGLAALKAGFTNCEALQQHFRLLSPLELQLLLCGHQHIHAEEVLRLLEFSNFPDTSSTPEHLRALIRSFSQNNLRRFLRLCTSSVAIPSSTMTGSVAESMTTQRAGGSSSNPRPRRVVIKVVRCGDVERLPVGHTCSMQLDLPDYDNKDTLARKLGVALAHVSDGFHVV